MMTANEIAPSITRARTTGDVDNLKRAIQARREFIRSRTLQIANQAGGPPPERRAAMQTSIDAVFALDQELARLSIEEELLDALERRADERRNEIEVEHLRGAIPAALKALPRATEAVREALAALDKAMSDHRAMIETIARFEQIGRPFPFNDQQLAALLELRSEVWRTRDLAVLEPPQHDDAWRTYPQSWGRYFEVHGGAYTPRRPVRFVPKVTDFAAAFDRPAGRRGPNGEHVRTAWVRGLN